MFKQSKIEKEFNLSTNKKKTLLEDVTKGYDCSLLQKKD